jgi:hypothetical protein
MADSMLFIGWSESARGREERGLEVFDEAIGLYGRMQQEGRIEGFDVCILTPNGDLGGYIQLHGSAEQIAAVQADEEFQRHLAAATVCVDGLRTIQGSTNEGVARQMEMYREAVAKVPQTA